MELTLSPQPTLAEIGQILLHLLQEFKVMQKDIAELKKDVSGLTSDIAELRTDVSGLKSDVAELRTDVSGLKEDFSELNADNSSIKTELRALRADVQEIKATQEMILIRLDRLEQEVHINHHYYQGTRKALHKAGNILATV